MQIWLDLVNKHCLLIRSRRISSAYTFSTGTFHVSVRFLSRIDIVLLLHVTRAPWRHFLCSILTTVSYRGGGTSFRWICLGRRGRLNGPQVSSDLCALCVMLFGRTGPGLVTFAELLTWGGLVTWHFFFYRVYALKFGMPGSFLPGMLFRMLLRVGIYCAEWDARVISTSVSFARL